MKILVTGATGQLGSAITKKLVDDGHEVRCLTRASSRLSLIEELPIEKIVGDVTEPDSLSAAVTGVEAVIHAAGVISYWAPMRQRMLEVNCHGTKNLLDAAAKANVRRLLLTSSIATVGYSEHGSADEQSEYNWQGMGIDYFDSKYHAEQLVLNDRRIEGLAVNPGIIFGQNDQHRNGGRMLIQVWQEKVFGIPPGITTASVLDDVADGHLFALQKGCAGQRYILGGTILSFKELYQRIASVVNKAAPTKLLSARQLRFVSRLLGVQSFFTREEPLLTPAMVKIVTRNRAYSSGKAIAELGFSPSPIEQGIRSCWDWYQENHVEV